MSLKRCGLGAIGNLLRKRELCGGTPQKIPGTTHFLPNLLNAAHCCVRAQSPGASAKSALVFSGLMQVVLFDRYCIKSIFIRGFLN